MKTTNLADKRQLQTDTSSEHEQLALSIDSNGVEHLMGTLTNLYSNPVESVFREYVSNAIDSHIKAKQSKPVAVDLRGNNRRELVVQDWGVGMNKDDIVNVYSKYASSTKRDSNEQIGAFGLGAKSALAIADRFDVVTVKDGVELTFFIQKNSRGAGVVHFVSELETEKPNGVTVRIPLTEEHFRQMTELTAAGKFFATWNPELVNLNGAPLPLQHNVYNESEYVTLHSGDDILGWLKLEGSTSSRNYGYSSADVANVAIAGIRYDINRNGVNGNNSASIKELISHTAQPFFNGLGAWGYNVIINLPLGSVDLTPSREDIMLTDKTRRTITVAFEKIAIEIPRAMQSRLDKEKFENAFAFYAKNLPVLGVKNKATSHFEFEPTPNLDNFGVKYHSDYIPSIIKSEKIVALEATNATKWEEKWATLSEISLFTLVNSNSRTSRSMFSSSRYYSSSKKPVVVYGEDTEANRAIITRNARSFTKSKYDNNYPSIYLVDVKPENKWLETVVDVVSVVELERIGKAYRSAQAKLAAENRSPAAKRPTAIHYGSIYNKDTDEVEIRKFSSQELGTYKRVVLINPAEADISTGYGYYNSQSAQAASGFWGYFVDLWDTDRTSFPNNLKIVQKLSKLFKDDVVIFLPKSRSTSPIEKANKNTVTIHKALSDIFEKASKTEKNLALVKAIAEMPMDFYGENHVVEAIAKESRVNEIKNKFTQEVFGQLSNDGQYLNAVVLSRIFVKMSKDDFEIKKSVNNHFRKVFPVWGNIPTNGWGSKFNYINGAYEHANENSKAKILVAMVNAIDSVGV